MKKITIVLFSFLLMFILTGCQSKDVFTDEEHLEKITKKIQKRYIDSGEFENFEIYPLYDIEDKLSYFVVDFYPNGYTFIEIQEKEYIFILGNSFYLNIGRYIDSVWRKYHIENNERIYEKDSSGNFIRYQVSPFKLAGIKDEKRYLIEVHQRNDLGHVPAVRRGDKYLNLVSMYEEEIVLKSDEEINASLYLIFYPAKPYFL